MQVENGHPNSYINVTQHITPFVREATNEEIATMVIASFSITRKAIADTDRMEYEWDDPLYVAMDKAHSALRAAMKLLQERPDPVKKRRAAERAAR